MERHDPGSFATKATRPGSPHRLAMPVAADSDHDRALGMSPVEDTGFDGFDAGTLAESWRQQPGAPCYCTDLTREELPAALAADVTARLPRRRDLAMAVIGELMNDADADQAVGWSTMKQAVREHGEPLGEDFLVRVNRLIYN